MSLTLMEKKGLVAAASFVAGILFLRRALAKQPPKGDVFIDQVQVQKTDWTPDDDQAAALTALQRQAMEELGVDLDLMAPTKKPGAMQVLDVESTIQKLNAAGRTGEGTFLATLLHEAQALPAAGGASA